MVGNLELRVSFLYRSKLNKFNGQSSSLTMLLKDTEKWLISFIVFTGL